DDVGNFATTRPTPARIRGTLDDEPARFRPPKPDPLLSVQKLETTVSILAVTAIDTPEGWKPASGKARLTVEGRLDDLHDADALLLGDGTAMDREEWDSFVRTGVVHVLAISGQHLVVLAAFVWLVLRTVGTRRRHGAWIVMAVMIGYTLLTGAKPSAVRAAV